MYVGTCSIEEAARHTDKSFRSKSMYFPAAYDYHLSAWSQQVRYLLTVLRLLKRDEPSVEENKFIHVFKGNDGHHYPFVLMPDYMDLSQYCFMSPFDYMYDYNRICATQLEGFNVQIATMPVIHREQVDAYVKAENGWREFLKKEVEQNYVPHFFGDKSKRVVWTVTKLEHHPCYGSLTETLVHNQHVLSRQGDSVRHHPYTVADTAINEGLCQSWEMLLGQNWFVKAHCVETGRTVCIVHVVRGLYGFHSKKIAVTHDPAYKQYSLVPMSNLVAIRHFMFNDKEPRFINLGVNFTPAGDYKNAINLAKEPMFNFPNVSSSDFQ